MSNDQQSVFFKAMMTGLFVGIIDTVICLVFNIGYRDITGYTPSNMINVSSLIFGINLVLLLIGILYFVFLWLFKKGDIVFIAVFVSLTILLIWKTEGVQLFPDSQVNNGFRGLLTGILLIVGGSTACLPLLYHSRKFAEHVL